MPSVQAQVWALVIGDNSVATSMDSDENAGKMLESGRLLGLLVGIVSDSEFFVLPTRSGASFGLPFAINVIRGVY